MSNITRPLNASANKAHIVGFRVDGTGTASILEGISDATLTDNDTGDYTLTFTRPGRRVPVVLGCVPLTANLQPQIESVTAAAINIKFTNNSGTATDTDFHLSLMMFGLPDAN